MKTRVEVEKAISSKANVISDLSVSMRKAKRAVSILEELNIDIPGELCSYLDALTVDLMSAKADLRILNTSLVLFDDLDRILG